MAGTDEALEALLETLPGTLDPRATITVAMLVDAGRNPPTARVTTPTLSELLPVFAESEAGSPDLQLKDLLGAGGMGQVHLAHQRSLDRDVAVKTVLRRSEDALLTLLHEGRVMGQLEHPNIIPVHALGLNRAGEPALVMKRVDGVTWSTLLQDPEHPAWERVDAGADRRAFHLQVLVQLGHALEFAHARGVLHRDLKPDNVMVGAFGEVYLLDWGIACALLEGVAPNPALVGTPAFMAPEMVRQEALSPASDVFLLGGALYYALTGATPHRGGSLAETFANALLVKRYEFPSDVPEELAAVCQRALAYAPEARYPSAAAFRSALLGYLRARGGLEILRATREQLREFDAALAAGDAALARRLFSACNFGLRLAERECTDKSEARRLREELVLRLARFELAQSRPDAALDLLAELADAPAELLEQAQRQRAEEAARRAHAEKLERVAEKFDLQRGGQERVAVLYALAGVLAAASLFLSVRERAGHTYTAGEAVLSSGGPLVALLGVVLRYRARLADELSRKLVYMLLLVLCALTGHRVVALARGLESHATVTADMLVVAVVLATAAITTHSLLWYVAAVELAGFLLASALPQASLHVFNLAQPLAVLLVALLTRSVTRSQRLLVEE